MDWFKVPSPRSTVRDWHVAPGIDVVAYALSWLWALIPLALLGPERADYVGVYVIILAATDVHRHYNFPYVYADREIRQRFPLRFLLFPGLLLLLFMASPWLSGLRVYLGAAEIGAGIAWVLVLLQLLRRDGGDDAAPVQTIFAVVGPMLALPLLLTVAEVPGPRRLGTATWWFAGALLSATYLDFELRRRLAAAREQGRDRAAREGEAIGPAAAAAGAGRRRLLVTPLLILALLIASTLWGPAFDASRPHGGVRVKSVLNGIAVVAFVWNVWHVYAQKYGIMRMYNAKGQTLDGARDPAAKVPGWIDRLFIFAWVPLYVAWLGPLHEDTLRRYFTKARDALPTAVDALRAVAPVTLPVAIGLLVTAVALWLVFERKVYGFRNRPRLWMAGGTFALGVAFLLFDPVKAYLAFSFSHAVEYMVFVWAFQRRRYAEPLPHEPLMQRVLRRPWLAYLGFTITLGVVFVYLKYYGRFVFADQPRPEFLGWRTSTWIGFWGVYQSMVHFYWDGFLWKMRTKDVRKTI